MTQTPTTQATPTQAPAPSAPRRVWQLAWCLVAVLLAQPLLADEFQRNGQWIEGTVVGIVDGELNYRTPAGTQRQVPMDELQSLKLDSEPQFFEALELFNGEDYRRSQRMFGEIAERTDAAWVRHYAQFYQVQALDKRGEPTDAAEVYVEMAGDGADVYFLSIPPVASLEEANDDQRNRIREEVLAVMEDAEDAIRDQLATYLQAVVGDEAMPVIPGGGPDTPGSTPGQVDRTASAVILPTVVWAMLEDDDAEEKWSAIPLLSEGKYDEALEALEPWLNNPADMPVKLFILGRAQLALADASGDRDMYLDAGLSFMRIVVHYGQNSRAPVAPARLEVAYIHREIGRQDLYDKLLFDNNLSLSFDNDTETYPQYYRRYYEILGEPLPSDETEPDNEDDDE